MLSHGNMTSDIDAATQYLKLYSEDSFLSILPIHHTFECTCGFLLPLSHGSSITYARGLASKLIVEDIKNNKATILLGVPLLYEKMYAGISRKIAERPPFTRALFKTIYGVSKFLKKAANVEAGKKLFHGMREKSGLSSIRLFVSGGAPLSPEVGEAFNTMGFKLIQGYGLTESAPILTLNPLEKYKNASIGVALPNAQLKILDPDNNGIGELIAKGPMIMKGYYKNDRATSETVIEGWLHTGDLARVDSDGYYYITGRKKNLIVTPGGKNVYPEEVEIALNNSPYILESLVRGRTLPSGGEEIEAIIVPDLDYFGLRAEEKGISLSEMHIEQTIKLEVAKQSEQLADYKRVKYVTLRDEDFEKTSTKKIKRYLYEHKPMAVPGGKDKDELK
jgi:long-chain acyl-CoA synthetase